MASFNGVNIFQVCIIETGTSERERQYNTFFGVQGTESLDGGFRHRISSARGVHSAVDANGLINRQDLFRSYEDQLCYTLVDNLGKVWYAVQLVQFNPEGKVMRAADGSCFQNYSAQFKHLAR